MIKQISKFGGGKQVPDMIVIHAMAEKINDGIHIYDAIDYLDFLTYSAHFLIHPDGEITQGRELVDIAYHARGFNTDSIGIEFLVAGTHDYTSFLKEIQTDYITDVQYQTGLSLVTELMKEFSISEISRHSDLSPGRKVDPGEGFKWLQFLQEIQ